MFNPADLPDTLALFPLPGALLLPRARLPLNIFEPRYLAMLEDALKTRHRLIGMVQPIERASGGEARDNLHAIGCAGRVVAFSETDDGRYRISLGGISRFRIRDLQPGFAPYLKASVAWDDYARDLGRSEQDGDFDREGFLALLGRYLSARGLSSDWENLTKADDELLINSLSMLCPFNVEDKQALLEARTLAERRQTMETLMEFSLASGGDNGKLQ